MPYLEIKIACSAEISEILIAELSGIDFDSFMELEDGINAYIEESLFNDTLFKNVLQTYLPQPSYFVAQMENKNWNEEWEKNFTPIIVEEKVFIGASFHYADKPYKYKIVIEPKMSFGTGHHETTYMMIQHQLEIDHNGKKLIDAGSGTGILAIMGCKLGATEIFAYDIEDWSFENIKENCILNGCNKINTAQGTIKTVQFPFPQSDILLANINKNVLLEEISAYSGLLSQGGFLVLSGFYESDIEDILKVCSISNLSLIEKKIRNNWASLRLKKN